MKKERKLSNKKKKPRNEAKKEYDKKRIAKILVF
jgi:hypothetical protein